MCALCFGTHSHRISRSVKSGIQTHVESCRDGGVWIVQQLFLIVVTFVSGGSPRSPKERRATVGQLVVPFLIWPDIRCIWYLKHPTTIEIKHQTFKLHFRMQQESEKLYFGFQFGNYSLLSLWYQSVELDQFDEKCKHMDIKVKPKQIQVHNVFGFNVSKDLFLC